MVKFDSGQKEIRCSFCAKTQDMVEKLVSGPNVYICNECIGLCNEIMDAMDEDLRMEQNEGQAGYKPPPPKEIITFLPWLFK